MLRRLRARVVDLAAHGCSQAMLVMTNVSRRVVHRQPVAVLILLAFSFSALSDLMHVFSIFFFIHITTQLSIVFSIFFIYITTH